MRHVVKRRGLRLLWRSAAFVVAIAGFALKAKIIGRTSAFVLLRLANALDAYARVLRLGLRRH
jgi:hypothetical protein